MFRFSWFTCFQCCLVSIRNGHKCTRSYTHYTHIYIVHNYLYVTHTTLERQHHNQTGRREGTFVVVILSKKEWAVGKHINFCVWFFFLIGKCTALTGCTFPAPVLRLWCRNGIDIDLRDFEGTRHVFGQTYPDTKWTAYKRNWNNIR